MVVWWARVWRRKKIQGKKAFNGIVCATFPKTSLKIWILFLYTLWYYRGFTNFNGGGGAWDQD